MMRGDAAEEALLERAAALVTQHRIDSDDQLGPLFQSPEHADPEVMRRHPPPWPELEGVVVRLDVAPEA